MTAGEPLQTVTHGRHCPCSACAREDWTRPDLAACGMHGPDCPPAYAPGEPLQTVIDRVEARANGAPPRRYAKGDVLRLAAAARTLSDALEALAGDVYLYSIGELSREQLLASQTAALDAVAYGRTGG